MESKRTAAATIDEYIAGYPAELQEILQRIRATVRECAPEASERISYQLPAFFLNGNLVYFGVFQKHISFFPTGSGVEAFKNELSGYKTSKGTIQLALDKPIPYDLIRRIVEFRVAENRKKTPRSMP